MAELPGSIAVFTASSLLESPEKLLVALETSEFKSIRIDNIPKDKAELLRFFQQLLDNLEIPNYWEHFFSVLLPWCHEIDDELLSRAHAVLIQPESPSKYWFTLEK